MLASNNVPAFVVFDELAACSVRWGAVEVAQLVRGMLGLGRKADRDLGDGSASRKWRIWMRSSDEAVRYWRRRRCLMAPSNCRTAAVK